MVIKRFNLQTILQEALRTAKECLETEKVDLGFVEHAIKKVERAGNEIVQQGYAGVAVDVLEFIAHNGRMVHINNSRDAVNQAQRQLFEQKQGSQRNEKLDFEHIKSTQVIAKQNLEVE